MSKTGIFLFFLPYLQLAKPKITFPVTLSALTGFLLYQGAFSPSWLALAVGVFLMAAGSSCINQLQEFRLDRMMARTRNRPIPSKKVSPLSASILSGIFSISGFVILWLFTSSLSAFIGFVTLAWYNGVYTFLKRLTAFAVVPGSLVGALPPIIGWTAAGGQIWHPSILLVAFFFFIGQIPHFWLIILRYDKEYRMAGFPVLSDLLSYQQIFRLTFVWVVATVLSGLMLFYFKIITLLPAITMLFVASFLLLFYFVVWLRRAKEKEKLKAFVFINSYYLLVMILIIISSLL